MSIDGELLEKIRANADFVIEKLGEVSDIDFGLDAASVGWVDGFIERQWEGLKDGSDERLINVFGSYLGEAIIAAVPGARWDEDDQRGLAVAFPNGDMAFPFNKVAKLIGDGHVDGDSIHDFYNVCVNYVATGKLRDPQEGEAP